MRTCSGIAFILGLAAPVLGDTSDFTIRHWDQSQGLSQASVTALAQDAREFLWVGTFGGLARFDGLSFRHLPLAGPDRVESFEVLCLLAEGDTLWVGTDRGLYRLAGEELESVPLPAPLADRPIATLYRATDGSLWLGSANDGIARLIDGEFAFEPSTGDGRVPALVRLGEDESGRLLLWSARVGPLRLAGKQLESPSAGEHRRIWEQIALAPPLPAPARGPARQPGPAGTARVDLGLYFAAAADPYPEINFNGLSRSVGLVAASPDGSVWLGAEDGLFRGAGGASVASLWVAAVARGSPRCSSTATALSGSEPMARAFTSSYRVCSARSPSMTASPDARSMV